MKEPDEIEELEIDRKSLPEGEYEKAGYESRQVIEIEMSRKVTEYRREILQDLMAINMWLSFPMGLLRQFSTDII